jgi:hypothetical protein
MVACRCSSAHLWCPQVRSYQADLEAARALALEEGDTGGSSRLLAYLPGAVLLNKEPPNAGPWPDASPNRVTRAVLSAVYSQLQDIVGVLGWVGIADTAVWWKIGCAVSPAVWPSSQEIALCCRFV